MRHRSVLPVSCILLTPDILLTDVMGCGASTQGTVHQPGQAGSSKPAAGSVNLPPETSPYEGDPVIYTFLQADVIMTASIGISSTTSTSNQQSYYPALKGPYSEGFTLVQFLAIPGATSIAGMSSAKMKYEAIYSKTQSATNESWNLRIDHCQVNIQSFRSGLFATSAQNQGDSGNLVVKVLEVAAMGGRLVCLASTMSSASGGMMAAMSKQQNMAIGVDVIFNIPASSSSVQYCYSAVNMPITFQGGMSGLMSTATQTQGDWEGTLNAHLSQGWRLVDVFLDMTNAASSMQGFTSVAGGINTIWFFEKEYEKLNNNTPQYEGKIIDYDQNISAGFGGTKAKTSWSPTIVAMGSHGWELACIVTTPGSAGSGFNMAMELKLIFQRKIVN